MQQLDVGAAEVGELLLFQIGDLSSESGLETLAPVVVNSLASVVTSSAADTQPP